MYLMVGVLNFILLITSLQVQEPVFSLTGKTSDIKNGTWLYLQDLVNGATLDSAQVKDNTFNFDTTLGDSRFWVLLHTRDRSHFKELWLQNKPMYFDASQSDFERAEISGSISQELVDEVKAIYENMDKLSDEQLRQRQERFIADNPNALISARMLYEVSGAWGQKITASYFEKFSNEIKESSLGKRILTFLNNEDIPQIGEKFTDFQLPAPSGKQLKFSELLGKATLLQFWATTCNPSKLQNKELKKLYRRYKSEGLEIIAISRDLHKEDWVKSIAKDNLKWIHLSSLKGWEGPVFRSYGISITPSNYLINAEGLVIGRNLRGDKLEETIQKLLK